MSCDGVEQRCVLMTMNCWQLLNFSVPREETMAIEVAIASVCTDCCGTRDAWAAERRSFSYSFAGRMWAPLVVQRSLQHRSIAAMLPGIIRNQFVFKTRQFAPSYDTPARPVRLCGLNVEQPQQTWDCEVPRKPRVYLSIRDWVRTERHNDSWRRTGT
jgi:hypothetical protein